MDTVKPTTILDIEVVGSSVYFLCLCEDNVVQYFHIGHLLDKNKNISEKMSEYVGFSPPPTYFLHTLLGLACLVYNSH